MQQLGACGPILLLSVLHGDLADGLVQPCRWNDAQDSQQCSNDQFLHAHLGWLGREDAMTGCLVKIYLKAMAEDHLAGVRVIQALDVEACVAS